MHNFKHLGRMDMGGTQTESSDQQQALVQQIAEALQKGTKPEALVKALVSKGLDVEQAKGIVSAVMQQMSGGDMSGQANPVAADGLEVNDGIWDDIVQGARNAYNTGKGYAKKAVNAVTHADPVSMIPFGSHLPSNVKALTRLGAANIGLGQGVPFLQKSDLSPEELKAIQTAALNAKKRSGQSSGGMKYSDYGKGYGDPWSNKMELLTNPIKTAQTSIGRFSYNVGPGSKVNVSDKYDFYGKDQGSLPARLVNFLDENLPANDPRRYINFNITSADTKKIGGLYKAADGVSIVDYLASKGQDFSKEARKKLAEQKGIKDYDFSAEKNLELLNLLRSQEAQGTPSAPVRKPVSTGKQPIVTPGPSTGRFGNYDARTNKIPYTAPDIRTEVKSASPTMTEAERTAAMIKTADMYTPSWKKKDAGKNLPDKAAAKKDAKTKSSQYVDLQQMYGLDPFSKEGIMKAQEIARTSPNTRFVCTAEGCSEIAVNAATAFGNDFARGNAWNLGNLNKVIAQNPAYASEIGKGILHDPTNYNAPVSVYQHPGAIIGLNRRNNKVSAASDINNMAITTGTANDSYDYANQRLYPGSRGYEHVGYMIDKNTMLHGTGKGEDHPAYYMIDPNVGNGVSLGGYGSYQPVEAIMPGGSSMGNWFSNLFKKSGGENIPYSGTYSAGVYYEDGGAYGGPILQNYMKETSPMYNFGGYFPQGPRFAEGGKMPQWLAEARFKASGSEDEMGKYGYADGGAYDNPGFRALPPMVQQKILRQRMYGGSYADGGTTDDGTTMDNTRMGLINVFKQGGIYIKPSKRGTFTAAAKKHGKSVQGFASQVLANKDNYSSAMVKKANFARNAAKWKHADGGIVVGQTYDATPEMLQKLQAGGYKFEYVD